jgi:putative tail protein
VARMALTLGVTAAGAVAGSYLPGVGTMLGAQLGMIAGSIAGALLFPGGEDHKGPRLGDLRVSDASYGMPIPIVYGAARVAGVMIWTSGLEERSDEVSMKGGGPTSTTYAYYSSFAMGLCEGPLASVRKIWLDTKLVYDVSSTNLGIINQRVGDIDPRHLLSPDELADRRDEIQAELNAVQSAMTVYLGTETQLPDPVMEAHEGVGEVPAHRGLAYLLFADLPLAAYGNRIPNVSAEVMTASAPAYPKVTVIPASDVNVDRVVLDQAREILWSVHQQTIHQVDALQNTLVRSEVVSTGVHGGSLQTPLYVGLAVDVDGFLYTALTGDATFHGRLARLDPVSLEVTHIGLSQITMAPIQLGTCSTLRVSQGFVWYTSYGLIHAAYAFMRPGAIDPATGLPLTLMRMTGSYTFSTAGPLNGLQGDMIAVDRDETAWIICSSPTVSSRTGLLHMHSDGTAQVFDLTPDIADATLIAYDAWTHSLIIGGQTAATSGVTRVLKWDIATQSTVMAADGVITTLGTVRSAWERGIVGRTLYYPAGFTNLYALDVDSLTLTVHEQIGLPGGWPTAQIHGGVYDPATQSMWVMESGVGFAKYYLDRIEPGTLTLGTIVEDLSVRAGLDTADVVTNTLTAPVHGFVVSQRAEARAALEQLLAAFLVDGVETDWHIVFQHRATVPAATLTVDDLAAHEPGATLPDVLTPERLDDQQLPIRLDITYADPARDYQDTVQHARRFQAGQRARSLREVRTPVLLTADQAKHLAEQSFTEAWVSRTTYKLMLPYKWTTVDPGDVLAVEALDTTSLMRVQQIQNGANGILEMTAVAYDAHIYTASPSVGVVADAVTQQTITMNAPTGLFLLDTHLLRDVDEGSGYYMAMAPQGSGAWSGATAFSSVDANAWRMEDTLTMGVDYGSAMSVLAAGSPYVLDYGHTVDIRMARGTLTSIALAELLNGANAGLLGQEILQWQTATALDATSWRLSNLLRGRRGTEWAITTHVQGERFLMLSPATLRREEMGLSEVGTPRLYRAVTMNTDAMTTAGQAFTNTALGLRPYSVEHVHGTRNAGNDLTLTWIRRTRLGGVWVDGRDVPLGEASEAYEIDVLVSGAVVRTLTSSVQNVLYLASQQTTDGITPGQPVTVTVYQIGQLGRGWPTTATV